MSDDWRTAGEAGLRFFGKMIASVSHEIKNVLAVVNESAGLLEDLTLMARSGRPLETERLMTVAERITHQVRRADGIVKTMNRFAHSVDASSATVDLSETLSLMLRLATRPAAMRGVQLQAHDSGRIAITTHPFLLENALWLCLEFAMAYSAKGKQIGVKASQTAQAARIEITPGDAIAPSAGGPFQNAEGKALLMLLGGRCEIDPEGRRLVLSLPAGEAGSPPA